MSALTIGEAAQALNVSANTVRNQIRAGNIPAFRVGRCLRIWPAALDRRRPIAMLNKYPCFVTRSSKLRHKYGTRKIGT